MKEIVCLVPLFQLPVSTFEFRFYFFCERASFGFKSLKIKFQERCLCNGRLEDGIPFD